MPEQTKPEPSAENIHLEPTLPGPDNEAEIRDVAIGRRDNPTKEPVENIHLEPQPVDLDEAETQPIATPRFVLPPDPFVNVNVDVRRPLTDKEIREANETNKAFLPAGGDKIQDAITDQKLKETQDFKIIDKAGEPFEPTPPGPNPPNSGGGGKKKLPPKVQEEQK